MTSRKYYSEIPILYFIATLFVTMLHIIQYTSLYHNRVMYFVKHIEASAVPLFLCIAGFLAFNRTVRDPKAWLWRKVKRIYIPYAIIMLPVMIYYSFAGEFSVYKWFMLLFALQGTQNYLIVNCNYYIAPTGLGHFWYVTIILICFSLTALIAWIAVKRQRKNGLSAQPIDAGKPSDLRVYLLLLCVIAAQFLFVYVHITILYIAAFFIGYSMAKQEFKFSTKNMLFFTAFAAVSFAARLIAQRYIDATTMYDLVIAPLQTMFIGIWIFVAVFWLREKLPALIDKTAANPIIKFIAGCVFEIYLIHSITLDGKINVLQFFDSELAAIFVSLVITLIASYLVNRAAKFINAAISIRGSVPSKD